MISSFFEIDFEIKTNAKKARRHFQVSKTEFAPNYLFRAILAAIILFLFFSIVYF